MKTLAPILTTALLATIQPATAASKSVDLRVVALSNQFPGKELYAHTTGGSQPGTKLTVKNFLNHESDKVTLASPAVVLTAKPDPASARDKEAVLGEYKIGAKTNSAILLCLPPTKEGKGSILLVEDAKSEFPPGSTKIINTTASEIRLNIQGKDFDVKADSQLLIRNQPVSENNSSAVKAMIKKGETWTAFSSTSWLHPGTKRVIQVITENANSGKPEIRGVKDISAAR